MTRFLFSSALGLSLLAGFVGCSSGAFGEATGGGGPGSSGVGGPSGSGAVTGANGSTGPGGTAASGTAGGATPMFETDVVPIFEKSCGAKDNACHSSVAYAATAAQSCRGWLSLQNDPLGSQIYGGPSAGTPTGCPDMPLYDRLLDLDAWMCGDTLIRYVVPCDVENSYLARKINGGPYCADADGLPSDPMPPNKDLDPGERAVLLAWIAGGAPRTDGTGVDCDGSGSASGVSSSAGQGPQAPVPTIDHPGDGETRPAGVPIPFIGSATDPQDGSVPGNNLSWTSDQIGGIGTGTSFDAPLPAGTHVVTLEATDSDGNVGSTSLTLTIE